MKKVLFFIFFLISITAFAQLKKFDTYHVKQGETLQSISKDISVSQEVLLLLNPDAKENFNQVKVLVIPNKDFNKKNDLINYKTEMVSSKDIIVEGYVYHEVMSKETIFGITQKYQVESGVLKHYNSFLMFDGLEVGQTLKIPLNKSEAKLEENGMNPYVVKPKETKYSIANEYGISIDSLETLNPEIKEGLQIDHIIYVPNKRGNSSVTNQFEVHTVKKEETLYSLSKSYNISQEQLLLANPGLELGVKEGMLIKIPRINYNKELLFSEEIGEKRTFSLAMMLPFLSKKDSLSSKEDRIQNVSTDFYFGALIALDSLKKQGISVNIQVFDTKNSESVSKKISSDSSLNNVELVIGPLFLNNLKVVSENLENKNMLIVSPISGQDHSFLNNENIIQDAPTNEQLSFEMLLYLKKNYTNQKLVVIVDDKVKQKSILDEISLLNSNSNITILKPEKGYIKRSKLIGALDTENENWILLIGNDDVLVADVIHNFGVLQEEINLTLFVFNKGKGFDKIDNNHLSRVNLHYPSSTYLDFSFVEIQQFINTYSERFGGFPSQFAFKGFDVTYDVLMRLSQNNLLTSQGTSQRLETKFNFIENTSGNVINQGVFILKYKDLQIEEVKSLIHQN